MGKRKHFENLVFNYLAKEEQVRLLFFKGRYLTTLFRKRTVILLFKLDDYFVEIYKSKHNGSIVASRAFRSVKRLYKYQLDYKSFGKRLIRISFQER